MVLPNSEKYKLISIANHLGSQIKYGHYQALIKIGSKWTICDDDKSFKTTLDKELNENNYVLVYEKIRSVEESPNSNIMEKMFENQADDFKEHEPQQKIEKAQLKEGENKRDQQKPQSEVPSNLFIFVKGKVTFGEVDHGKIKCGGCGKIFSRIVGHLTKNLDCARNIDLEEFKSIWSKFTSRRRQDQFRNKKITENKDQSLKEEASRKRKFYQQQCAENKEQFLKEEACRKRKLYQDQRPVNKELFLKDKAKRMRRTYQNKNAENKEQFLKDKAKK